MRSMIFYDRYMHGQKKHKENSCKQEKNSHEE